MRKFSKSKTYRTMINYSIVKRSVNANLIKINQAKSRINQAKKEGKTPQPADLAAILYLTVDCMREQLLEGKKIRLGDLGDFSVSLLQGCGGPQRLQCSEHHWCEGDLGARRRVQVTP